MNTASDTATDSSKRELSKWIVLLLAICTLAIRLFYVAPNEKPLKVTTWDALGYYMFLPAVLVYDDCTELAWFEEKEKEYNLSGGVLYQYRELENGNRVGKYFVGLAVMQLPWFAIGHVSANFFGHSPDGFSLPYQYSIAFGALVYFLLALFLIRNVLLRYYEDYIVSICLLVLVLGTNVLQYTAVDGAMVHSYLFLLYSLQLYLTVRWHDNPSKLLAALIGFTVGLAVLCRPTEALMLFIPLLWNIHDKDSRKQKWQLIKANRSHALFAVIAGGIAFLPQLVYWKTVTGSVIYDVGSKWTFLNPWFRVLFGFEKGWFVYTPLTLLIIAGFFFLKGKPFRSSVLTFGILNIWLIISWFDWRYGGSYSTRALVQSLPIMTLPLAAVLSMIYSTKWKYLLTPILVYLVIANVFQIYQYNEGILLNDGMNRQYYSAIYMDVNPSPLDFSILDTEESFNPAGLKGDTLVNLTAHTIRSHHDSTHFFFQSENQNFGKETWIQVQADLTSFNGLPDSFLACDLLSADTTKYTGVRIAQPLAEAGKIHQYEFYFKIPADYPDGIFRCYIKANAHYHGNLRTMKIVRYLSR
jgi:hypothetical protein